MLKSALNETTAAETGAADARKTVAGTAAVPRRKADEVRARALVPALAGLVILSIAMLLLTWYGARVVRRRTRKVLGPTHPVGDEWSSKPLASRPERPSDKQPPQGA